MLSETMINTCGPHPITEGLGDISVTDERYSYLSTEPDITVLGQHAHDHLWHPVVWARDTGAGRVVYDGLGHDTRSYDSPGHVGADPAQRVLAARVLTRRNAT